MRKPNITAGLVMSAILLASCLTFEAIGKAAETPERTASSSGQPVASPGANNELSTLKQQLALQQKQIEQLRLTLDQQAKLLERALESAGTGSSAQAQERIKSPSPVTPSLGPVASTSPIIPAGPKATANRDVVSLPAAALAMPVANPQDKQAEEASPLQLRIGSAYIIPVGFMDFTAVWRSHDGGSGIGTNFASIPYGAVFQNKLSEFRLNMQNSRIGFRVDALVKGAHVIGYMESDFLGNNPGNVAVSSNSNTLRSRVYWVDVEKSKWEFLGGQTWSLITPGRTGISPLPGNLFYTQNIDVNYQLGLVWGRIPEFRFVYHPTDKVAFGVALDSPEQYVGGSAGGSTVTFQPALSSTYAGGELNTGGTTLAVPNTAPDVIAKLALDPFKKFHFEVGGVERTFKLWNPTTNTTYSTAGGGGFVNLNFELFNGFRLFTNNFWSDGGGRYIFGQAPDLIARVNGSPSLIHADSTVSGLEYTHKNTLLYAYYGGLYVGRNFAIVPVTTTSGTPPKTTTKLTPFGYGYTGSPSSQNRAVQEGTLGFAQTFWKDAKYGTLTLMGQYSYLIRNPWFVATGQPKEAHLNMVFLNLRYTLPGSAPAIK